MKYFVDISQKQSEQIQKLIDKNDYNSFAQFIKVSIENQISIELNDIESTNEKPVVEIGRQGKNSPQKAEEQDFNITKIDSHPIPVEYPLFEQLTLGLLHTDETKTWLWGQINRLLPVKIGLRILLKEIGNESMIEREEFALKAAQIASSIGTAIKTRELQLDKMRDEKISAGLPTPDEKSLSRYKAQFLGYKRSDGLLDGAMPVMKFVNITTNKKGKDLLGLTKAGIEFATLLSPVLDDSNYDLSLSDEEIAFYLRHIKENVRSEYLSIKWLLSKIHSGINERDEINKHLNNDYGEIWNASSAVINTQRAGLTARMTELNLIEKEKSGIYVTYSLSKSGATFLQDN